MKALKITVVRSKSGPDTLLIEVDKPNGCWPYNGNATVKMDIAADTAEEYLKNNFSNIPYEIVGA